MSVHEWGLCGHLHHHQCQLNGRRVSLCGPMDLSLYVLSAGKNFYSDLSLSLLWYIILRVVELGPQIIVMFVYSWELLSKKWRMKMGKSCLIIEIVAITFKSISLILQVRHVWRKFFEKIAAFYPSSPIFFLFLNFYF